MYRSASPPPPLSLGDDSHWKKKKCLFSLPLSLGIALISPTSRLILEGALRSRSPWLITLPVFVFMCFRQASEKIEGEGEGEEAQEHI